jgi:hypothetical protein
VVSSICARICVQRGFDFFFRTGTINDGGVILRDDAFFARPSMPA